MAKNHNLRFHMKNTLDCYEKRLKNRKLYGNVYEKNIYFCFSHLRSLFSEKTNLQFSQPFLWKGTPHNRPCFVLNLVHHTHDCKRPMGASALTPESLFGLLFSDLPPFPSPHPETPRSNRHAGFFPSS